MSNQKITTDMLYELFKDFKEDFKDHKREVNHNFEKLFDLIEKREFKLKYTWALTTLFVAVFTSFMAIVFARGI